MARISGITVFEFDALAESTSDFVGDVGVHAVPTNVYRWLERRCLQSGEERGAEWLRLTQRRGRRVVQLTSFVGVIRAPDGYQIEVLPKVGKAIGGGVVEARRLLIEMLRCLPSFRHIQTDNANLSAAFMPLLEIFIAEFLRTVEHIVKRGLRGAYIGRQDNLFALRGKLLLPPHLRQNLHRADRFFVDYDELSTNRPENRLLHAALHRVLSISTLHPNQRLARELAFVFADVPPSTSVLSDFQQVRLDRGMGYYVEALAWARLILNEESPLTGTGLNTAQSLLFPMEFLFEAFVAKHLARQVSRPLLLSAQKRTHHLVRHSEQDWFLLKPDLLIRRADCDVLVLDTKWKLLDSRRSTGSEKYGLSQADFYQLQAYGLSYLDGEGDVVLIYPKTEAFDKPLPVFEFPKAKGLRLWVLPFCLSTHSLSLPDEAPFASSFRMLPTGSRL